MADQFPVNPDSNGPADQGNEPHIATIAQYVKDLSVESPSAPQVFQWQVQPQLDVQFHINIEQVSDDIQEVQLKMDVAAKSESGVHFLIDLTYAGLFGFRNIPPEALQPFLLVEAPRLLFPFARQIVSESTQNLGFPPLLLDPIDFGSAYLQQLEQFQAEGGGTTNGGGAPTPSDAPVAPSMDASSDA